jgi:hypothetical protein
MKKPETEAKPAVARGKYANLLKRGSNLVILDPALMPFFPDSASVNRALHAFLAIDDQIKSAATPRRARRRPSSSAAPEFDPRVGIQNHQASR